ncbi:hypothetical protein OUZ56_028591 [Daphnia magna]|uniref:Uncharacterized protein n=1 Tax=Daphnia magna TaxID=35525 RepID=A0ABR0B4C4_9CRUS|nr:hypothetical protein OUZ56_028591 [Daphnia magna]
MAGRQQNSFLSSMVNELKQKTSSMNQTSSEHEQQMSSSSSSIRTSVTSSSASYSTATVEGQNPGNGAEEEFYDNDVRDWLNNDQVE